MFESAMVVFQCRLEFPVFLLNLPQMAVLFLNVLDQLRVGLLIGYLIQLLNLLLKLKPGFC